MKILVTNSWVTPHVEEIRGDFPTVEFVIPGSDEDKTAAAADAEVAFGSVTAELLTAAPALKWVHAASAGVEWMPPELAATDIVVTNTRGAHASTIAEHGFGMLVYLARRFEDLRQGAHVARSQADLQQEIRDSSGCHAPKLRNKTAALQSFCKRLSGYQ